MSRRAQIHPAQVLLPGRYHLDRYGRLHAAPPRGMRTITMVTVRPKATGETKPGAQQLGGHPSAGKPLPTTRPEDKPMRPMARTVKPAIVQNTSQDVPLSIDDTAVVAEFQAKLKAVQARRGQVIPPPPPPMVNAARIAAAHRAKSLGPAPKKTPTRRALADCACHRCGTRTTIGCDHFLPYLGDARA